MSFKDVIDWLLQNWGVFLHAPIPFVLALVAGYVGSRAWHQRTIDILNQRLLAKDDQLDQLRRGAGVAVAKKEETSSYYSRLSNDQLRDETLKLVGKLRDLARASYERDLPSSGRDLTPEQFIQEFHDRNDRSYLRGQGVMERYDREFKVEALLLRDELVSRLPQATHVGALAGYKPSARFYETPTNPLGIAAVADDLEGMAKQLR